MDVSGHYRLQLKKGHNSHLEAVVKSIVKMPKKKSTDTLTDICVKNIARNMDSYWLADLDNSFGENPYLLYIVGPFEHLTACQIQKLIYTLSSLKLLKRRHLQILISSVLKSLDLSKSTIAANNGLILKSVSYRCQKLTSLNITGCNYITPNVIAESIRNLPLLKHLGLSRTKTNDMVLSVVGDYCEYLQMLDISGCVISNKGADNLCQTYSKDGPKCSSLQKLNIQGTNINIKGAVPIIQTFKDLRLFDFIESLEAVISVLENCRSSNSEIAFKFTKLSCMRQTFDSEDLKMVVRNCPFVSEFAIYCPVKSEYLLYLRDLKFLCNLVICNEVTGLLPLIKAKGDNLTSLALNNVDDLNAETLGKYCPNLQNLNIGVMQSTASFDRSVQNIYKKLENLTIIVENNEESFHPIDLSTILENAINLKKLCFVNIQSLTDNLFKQVLIFNPLMKMEELYIEDCNSITEDIFWELITKENPLQKIILTQCRQITQKNFESFKKYVKQNCFDLILSYD